MVARLTLEQKIELLGGSDGMYTTPLPAISLPSFKMSDGPVGVRTWGRRLPTPQAPRWPPHGTPIWRAKSARPWDATRAPAALTSCSAPA